MDEAYCKAKLRDAFSTGLRGCMLTRIEDIFKIGSPDAIITWHGHSTFLEAKYGDKLKFSSGTQKLTCQRLAKQGSCWIPFFEVKKGVRRTLIVHPQEVDHIDNIPDERVTDGFDYDFVVAFIRREHDHHKQEQVSSSTYDERGQEGAATRSTEG